MAYHLYAIFTDKLQVSTVRHIIYTPCSVQTASIKKYIYKLQISINRLFAISSYTPYIQTANTAPTVRHIMIRHIYKLQISTVRHIIYTPYLQTANINCPLYHVYAVFPTGRVNCTVRTNQFHQVSASVISYATVYQLNVSLPSASSVHYFANCS